MELNFGADIKMSIIASVMPVSFKLLHREANNKRRCDARGRTCWIEKAVRSFLESSDATLDCILCRSSSEMVGRISMRLDAKKFSRPSLSSHDPFNLLPRPNKGRSDGAGFRRIMYIFQDNHS